MPRAANAGHGTASSRGEASWAGGRAVSSNYALLLEGSKEFSTLADRCWRDLQHHASRLLAEAPRWKTRDEELSGLLEDLCATRVSSPVAAGGNPLTMSSASLLR